ncbi:MAG: hypothetical protein RLZZ383_1053 [Pseudomonadota bacterium]|jgi:hypothetical protein
MNGASGRLARRVGWLAVLAGIAAPGAVGQEERGVPSTVAPSYRDGWRWERVGPTDLNDIADVAVDGSGLGWLAVRDDGEAWYSPDGGQTWAVVLPPMPGAEVSKEDVLLDVETRMNELLDELGVGSEYVSPEEIEDADLVEQLKADIQGGSVQRDASAVASQSAPKALVSTSRALAVGRADGLWTSEDEGLTWQHVFEEPVIDASERGYQWLVLTDDAVWTRRDGGSWSREAALGDGPADAAHGIGTAFAVAGDRLFERAVDGTWSDRGAVDREARLADDGKGGVWVVSASGADLQQQGIPAVGSRALDAVRLTTGRLMVAARVGVFEWSPGEEGWSVLGDGLGDLHPRGIATWLAENAEHPVVGAQEGVFRLEPEKAAALQRDDTWVNIDALIADADARHTRLTGGERLGPSAQWMRYALPQVRVVGFRDVGGGVQSRLDGGIESDRSLRTGAWIYLTWTPPRRNIVSAGDAAVAFDGEDFDVYAGDVDQWMMLGRTSRDATRDRLALLEQVGALYAEGLRLRREIDAVKAGRTLQQRVDLLLRLQEVEARLDTLTDGTVSRYRAALRERLELAP